MGSATLGVTLWCTHGATQALCGEGLRQDGQRYTGCEAGFTVWSVKVGKKGDEHMVLYRVRNSQSGKKHNILPGALKLPNHFPHSFQTLWCTHGATQALCGEGLRQDGQRYTGCEAGFTVRSVKLGKKGVAKWMVCIDQEAEVSTHNHKTMKIIYEPYKCAKQMPLTTKVRQDLGLMIEMKTSTAAISRYLSD
ncbi:hypothetical protein PR003_g12853 [Phytophthora rubi]|uniref:Uncharacterized protein n=1 Tax=Phytophthora rubi TaxID=129364 RepID=A0A6A3MAS0_9STRA|nr:hypothetical protein PR002_g20713 [Phytophthora rubi]KAE9026725.1 hypothetical protein PR001_g12129 [Phytophthora rubi]KAE9335756.1 hypothetical protein PR003_g12853 [Phytophthora rubi]